MKFLYRYHLTHYITSLKNKIGSSTCALQQIFSISYACWNFSAILAPISFMLMPKTEIKFCKVCSFIAYSKIDLA